MDGGMMVLGCDVGEHAALGLVRDDVPIYAVPVSHCNKARGRAELLAALYQIKAVYGVPDRIVIERPTRNPKSRIDDYATLCERAGEMVALCEIVFPGVRILRPFPLPRLGQPGWQSIKEGIVDKDAKGKSLQLVQRSKAGAEVLAVCEGSHDCCDAVGLALWGAGLR